MNETVLFNTIETQSGGRIGRVTLNQERALNALNLDMVSAILKQLESWKSDDSIVCIFIEGAGDRALCAGGDIKAMYFDMQETQGKKTEHFFEHEYRMDYTLHTYPKPIIAWGTGIVMGGGLGIFMGSDIRIVSEKSRLAMPEITIGLFPDVGASYFLNRLPQLIGRFMALTGAIANATDALELGLANTLLSHAQKDIFLSTISNIAFSGEKQQDLTALFSAAEILRSSHKFDLPSSELPVAKKLLGSVFTQEDSKQLIDDFLAIETDNAWIKKSQANLKNGSPLSALIIDEQFKRAQNYTLEEAFKSEMVLSANIARFTEFSEGVRALLIDKDNDPKWHYASHRDIPEAFVDAFFASPWESNPLAI
ncbi:MAG: enoyl-CoA hydratase/isomerase family protein [Agarilytica sp.]